MKVICIGDMGHGGKDQKKVSKLMGLLMGKYNISFVSGLGDNIYPSGCKDKNDIQFKRKFERPYSNLPNKIPWYMILGNHDYGYIYGTTGIPEAIDNSQSQLDYHDYSVKKGGKWRMPAKYYSYGKDPVEFFALDTNFDQLSPSEINTQKRVMIDKIKASKKKWKIVVGHHTWRSIAEHGNAEFPELEKFLTELSKKTDMDAYICGHDHCKSLVLKKVNNREIPLIVCGTGGESYNYTLSPGNMSIDNSKLYFFSPHLGVCLLDITEKRIVYTFYDSDGKIEYVYRSTK